MRTGQVEVNGGGFNPVGALRRLQAVGHRRERGTYGLEEFLEVKSLQL